MHISITGDLGSGKSTVAKEICRILGYKYLSTGSIQRQLGQEMGMNTLEFNKFANDNKEVDDYIDQKLKDINFQTEPYVLDSRLGWHFVNKSFKIYAMAIDEVAATRVLMDGKRIGEPDSGDLQTKIKHQKERRRIENERFEKIYGIKPSIFNDFDAIIDTSTATVEEVTNLVLELYKKHQKNEHFIKIWLSPRRIFPTKNDVNLNDEVLKKIQEDIAENNFKDEFPIRCVLHNKEFYVFDGHKRLSASLILNVPFIPVFLVAKDKESVTPKETANSFVSKNADPVYISEWEEKHNFKFFHYPADPEE